MFLSTLFLGMAVEASAICARVMTSAWAPQSLATYAPSISLWRDFVGTKGLNDNHFLLSQTYSFKRDLWILFLDHVASTKKSVSAIDIATSAIRYFFTTNFQDSSFLEDESIKALKKGFKNTIIAMHPPASNTKVPNTPTSIMELWTLHGGGMFGRMSSTRHYMAVLACSIQFNFALRVSNVVRSSANVKHHLLVRDVTIECPSGNFVDPIAFTSNPSSLPSSSIVAVHFVEHSSKTTSKFSSTSRVLSLPSANPDNMFLITKLLHWMTIADHQTLSDDFFSFSYLGGKTGTCRYTRNCNRSDVAEVIKQVSTHLGLDPNLFSTHSNRSGAITTLKMRGENPTDVQHLSNHKSVTCFQSYDRAAIAMSALSPSQPSNKTFTPRDQALILLSRPNGGMNG